MDSVCLANQWEMGGGEGETSCSYSVSSPKETMPQSQKGKRKSEGRQEKVKGEKKEEETLLLRKQTKQRQTVTDPDQIGSPVFGANVELSLGTGEGQQLAGNAQVTFQQSFVYLHLTCL